MFKIFIAEDEIKTLNSIKMLIEEFCVDVKIIATAQSVKSAVNFLSSNNVDLLLSDINFPDGTGFDILEQIKYDNIKVIFITAFEEYALKAIKVSASDYILKPLKPKELIESIDKILRQKEDNNERLLKIETLLSNINSSEESLKKIILKTSERNCLIDIEDIVRCESENSYTVFHLRNKKKIVTSNVLKEYDEILSDSGFLRTHKSHLVNIDFITSYEKSGGGYLLLKDLTKVPVSVRKREYVLNYLDNYY